MSEAQKTPAAKWRQEGQADPHGDRYNCQRAALTLGEYTDDELANGVFLHGNEPLNINALIRKTPGYHSSIAWLTAAQDRIRWLSRTVEESAAREQALQQRLNAADQRINELTESQTDRSPQDYAVEHAEYMAKSADDVLAKFQAYGLALLAVDEGGDDGEGELLEAIDSTRQDLQESLVDLRGMVYEFRKRSNRCTPQ